VEAKAVVRRLWQRRSAFIISVTIDGTPRVDFRNEVETNPPAASQRLFRTPSR